MSDDKKVGPLGKEPVAITNLVVTALNATLPVLVAFGVATFSNQEMAAINAAIVAWTGLIGALISRQLVTPVDHPRDHDGRPLTAVDPGTST
jgi:hypothetical protein